jgi:hypothetical protein
VQAYTNPELSPNFSSMVDQFNRVLYLSLSFTHSASIFCLCMYVSVASCARDVLSRFASMTCRELRVSWPLTVRQWGLWVGTEIVKRENINERTEMLTLFISTCRVPLFLSLSLSLSLSLCVCVSTLR